MSFINDFRLFNQGNECPEPFVLWTAYGVLSATIGRRVHLDLKHFRVIPNVYILLVAPSGHRKTASRDVGVDMLLQAVPDIVIAGDNETYQGMLNYMNKEDSTRFYKDEQGHTVSYKPYCIFASELMDYLQLNPIGMVSFLTNIFDRKFYNYRLKNENLILEKPYVMMCACSTPEWLTDQIKAKQFAEGYGRRTVIVCHEGFKRKKPTLTEADLEAYVRCIQHLKDIQLVAGPMTMDEEADAWYWDWYINVKDPADEFLKKWYSTKHVNLLKVAILTSISERSDRIITVDYLKLSLALLNEVEKNLPMVTNLMGRSEVSKPAEQLLVLLRDNKGFMQAKDVKLRTLKNFKNTTEQWQVIEFLKTTEKIKEVAKDGKAYYALYAAVKETPKTDQNDKNENQTTS